MIPLILALTLCTDTGCRPVTVPIIVTEDTVTDDRGTWQFTSLRYDLAAGRIDAFGQATYPQFDQFRDGFE